MRLLKYQAVTKSVNPGSSFFLIGVFFFLFSTSICQQLNQNFFSGHYLILSWLSCTYLEALWPLILLSLSQFFFKLKKCIGHILIHLEVLTVDTTTMSLILSLILNWVVISLCSLKHFSILFFAVWSLESVSSSNFWTLYTLSFLLANWPIIC